MQALSSEIDILAKYGLIAKGASVCPTKMSATVEKLSAPLVLKKRISNRPKPSMMKGITRR